MQLSEKEKEMGASFKLTTNKWILRKNREIKIMWWYVWTRKNMVMGKFEWSSE